MTLADTEETCDFCGDVFDWTTDAAVERRSDPDNQHDGWFCSPACAEADRTQRNGELTCSHCEGLVGWGDLLEVACDWADGSRAVICAECSEEPPC